MSYPVKTTLCHDITTYDILWQPYFTVRRLELLTAHETEMEELDSPTSAVALTFLGRKGAGGSGEESKALNTTQNSIFL